MQEVIQSLGVNPATGLTDNEAAKRLKKYGANRLVVEPEIRFLDILREEITEPMIILLLAVGVLYSVLGTLTDALTIVVIIVILVLVEVWNEYRAKRSIASLRKLAPPTTFVLRNGKVQEVQTTLLVPGDVILLKTEQRVPADARLLEAFGLEVDEASLTGESLPVAKDAAVVLPSETRIPEQRNMLFAGTIVTRGQAKALITATGAGTELGRVTGIAKAAREPRTPLQLYMKQLSKSLVWIAFFFSVLVPVLGFVRGLAVEQMVLTGLALAFAVIPEELPIIITMVLGVGAYALSKKGALVKRLRGAETLGSVTVIATDKTGTITEGKMKVEHLYFDGRTLPTQEFKENEKEALKTALLASEALKDATSNQVLGNPMAQALLEQLEQDAVNVQQLTESWVLKDELSFDNKRKLASYVYKYRNFKVVLSSGAPENVLANSTSILLKGEEVKLADANRMEVAKAMVEMAQSGERLLAFAYRRLPHGSALKRETIERELVFVGIVGFIDPPRKEVKGAIRTCQEAGIKVIMVTGDHPETARTIATQVGIDSRRVLTGNEIARMSDGEVKKALKETAVFARVTPEDKLRLVRLIRENGEVVAVTGDGINDAPAIKEAHIGVAMGLRGTDVAKETADMVLTDDNFATIETAVREGRKLYSNLRKGVRYYLACKIALVASFLLPIALGVPLPFAPIQIIMLELFMDLAASATFVAEPEESGTMTKPPINPKERFMNRSMLQTMSLGALSLFTAVSFNFLSTWFLTQNLTLAQTMAFATWMLGHVFLALNFRSEKEPLAKRGFFSNKVMVLWAILVIATLLVGTNLSFIHDSLRITYLSLQDWALVIIVSFVATFWMELKKTLRF
ncbi:cation-transporting P-type ATPase [Candidatus Bathyarchaeota archaeon A05DMB-2]|jgi:Ca2+-transporting ATPase|nr:cation-transporting P-type ATPase [Candidatus Bathyarchaeota archaeon A05DMB-2]